MGKLPENLNLLRQGENDIRDQSIRSIEAGPDLTMHVKMIEQVMDTLQFYRVNYNENTPEQITVLLLGARIFNSIAASFGLIVSGYYQAGGVHTRDVLETTFLLDYFSTDLRLVSKWMAASHQVRKKDYGLVKIRKALDDRDGYTTQKRYEHYKLLCNLAAHPTAEGIGLLRPSHDDLAVMGPYRSDLWLNASIEELVKVCLLASDVFVKFFPSKDLPHMKASLARIEGSAAWFKRFFSVDKSTEIAEMKELANAVERHATTPIFKKCAADRKR